MEENIESKYNKLKEKNSLTKEYLKRALIKLQGTIQFFDEEIDESDDEIEKINKFVSEVKRKNIL
jgi:hypothetical protein